MNRILRILAVYIIGEAIAVTKVDDIIVKADRSKCDCCQPPCCCKCAQRITTVEVTTLPPPTTTMGVVECNNTLDLCFVIDSSGSISDKNWGIVKKFIKDVVSSFTIGRADTRVALVQYSTNSTLEWMLKSLQTSSLSRLQDAIDGLENIGKFTNTVEGMEVAADVVFVKKNGDRPKTPNVCVVITDGRSNFRTGEIVPMSIKLQGKTEGGGGVVAVGVTDNVNQTELEIIATGDGDDNVYRVENFRALESILQSLVQTVCEEIPTRPPLTTPEPITKVEEHCICTCPPVKYDYEFEDCKDCYDD